MSISIDMYPVLNDNLVGKIGFFADEFLFYYFDEDRNSMQNLETNKTNDHASSSLVINDSKCKWHADNFSLNFTRRYIFQAASFLFGNKGITHEDSIIGVALLWLSKSSSQRGTIDIGTLINNKQKCEVLLKGEFLPGQIRGSVTLQTVLYLKSIPNDTFGYAKCVGTILGVLDEHTVILDGSGSEFPIVEVSESSQPLWYVKCDWIDPLIDSFTEENVCLCINNAHRHFSLLKLEDGIGSSPLFTEILASAMQTIVQKVASSNYIDKIMSGEEVEAGSIGQVVHYFITTFGWDSASPDRLAASIRKDMDSRF